MVKMAHAPLPKLMCKPLNTSSMCPTDFATSTALSDVSPIYDIHIDVFRRATV